MLTTYLSVLDLQPFTHACFSFRCVWKAFRYYNPVASPRSCLSALNRVLIPSSSLQPALETQETRHGQLTDHQDRSYAPIHNSNQVSMELFPCPTHELTINDPSVIKMRCLFTSHSPPLPSQGTRRTLAVVRSRAPIPIAFIYDEWYM